MHIAVSTGTFYQIPFPRALALIKAAGFDYIEVLLHWQGGDNWEMAQHLRGIPPRDVLRMVEDSGLEISSLHDGGGVIEEGAGSVVMPCVYEYLEYGDIPCMVFHTPHKRTDDPHWWENYRIKAGDDLRAIGEKCIVCVENMFHFPGYAVPLVEPAEMMRFISENGLYANIDTTHCAQAGTDIIQAAKALGGRVRAVHLSDYAEGKAHLFPGEGILELTGFFAALDKPKLHAVTLECDIAYDESDEARTIARLREARAFAQKMVG